MNLFYKKPAQKSGFHRFAHGQVGCSLPSLNRTILKIAVPASMLNTMLQQSLAMRQDGTMQRFKRLVYTGHPPARWVLVFCFFVAVPASGLGSRHQQSLAPFSFFCGFFFHSFICVSFASGCLFPAIYSAISFPFLAASFAV